MIVESSHGGGCGLDLVHLDIVKGLSRLETDGLLLNIVIKRDLHRGLEGVLDAGLLGGGPGIGAWGVCDAWHDGV